jgi:hypothetical protein
LKEYPFPIKMGLRFRNSIKALGNKFYEYENARSCCFDSFKKKYLTFGTKAYNDMSDLYRYVPKYDCFVAGSDQIWNPLIHGNTNNKAYFLDFVPQGKRKIAYAPSIGISKVPESCEREMGMLINDFNAVSVREIEGKRIVETVSDKECRVVLDPTLLLDSQQWEKIASPAKFKKPYIFCYIFSEREYIGEFIEYVKKTLGMDIVTIPFTKREFESDYIKVKKAGPGDFLSLIKNSALVITDSFHATAFSINLNIPFYSLLRNSITEQNNMNSRIDSILSMTGLENRKIASREDFPTVPNLCVDFSNSNEIIKEKRAKDIEWLREALEG